MGKYLPFHIQLRHERERRGWSQADVASKVGSDPKTVGRWEQGKTLPRPYHRQALCELFEKNAEEFGLVPEQSAIIPSALSETDTLPLSPAREVPSTIPSPPDSKARTYQNIINLPPPTSPRTIQQREKDVQTIYAQLLQRDTTVVVLTGMGGVGKSTLAALVYRYALEHNQAGESPFAAQPLWLTINENVTMIDLLGTLLPTGCATR